MFHSFTFQYELNWRYIKLFCIEIATRKHDRLFQSVFEALSQMAPAAQYLKTDVKTSTGHVIGTVSLSCSF